MNLQQIRERRATTIQAMRGLTDAASTADRDLSDDEVRSFDTHKATLAKLDKDLERANIVTEAERSLAAVDPRAPRRGNDGTFEEQCRSFSVTRAIAAALDPSVDAGRERELSGEIAQRSGRKPTGIFIPHEVFIERRDVTVGGSGGNLVGDVHRPDLFIDRLRASLQVQALGATVLDGLVGNIEIPRLTGSATGYWVAEHGAVTESDQTFDQVGLAPKTVGAEVEYSRRMLINAVPSVERLVRSDLASVIATAIDAAAIRGTGMSNQPLGILNTPNIGDVSLATPTWEAVLDIIATVQSANADTGRLGWLTHPNVVKVLRSTLRAASTDSRMIMETATQLADYALRTSTQVPAGGSPADGALIFANWADLLIGYWSAVDILVNPYHTDVYSKGGVKINALQDCDIDVRHVASFAAATDIDA